MKRFAYLGSETPRDSLADELLFNKYSGLLACDIETVSITDTQIVGIGLCDEQGNAFYFPSTSSDLPEVLRLLNDPNIVKIFHNGLFDLPSLEEQYEVQITADSLLDTMIMAQLAGYSSKLTTLALECGTQSQDMKIVLGKCKTTLELPIEVLAQKCCLDVQATMIAYHHLKDLVDMDYVREEMKLIPIIIAIQRRGLVIDHEMRLAMGEKLLEEAECYREICKDIGFNPGSPQQVGYILAKRGHSRVLSHREGKTVYVTGEDILTKLDDPLAAVVLNYRRVNKEYGTYIKPLEGLDKLTTHFSFETATRRLASAKFNLQNWPKHLRKIAIGPFSGFDFSQQELRTLTYITGDKVMQGVYDRGEDIHTATASFMYDIPIDKVTPEIRRPCKNTVFCRLYGGGVQAIADTAGVSRNKAEQLLNDWSRTYKRTAEWIEDIQEFGLRHLKVPTIGGAWMHIKATHPEDIKKRAVNYVIQGSAAELTKKAMVKCKDLPMVLQIHDELLFAGDVREELKSLDLEHIGPFPTPVDMKLVDRWA